MLAREYVELTLMKHRLYDVKDVYWMADTAFWKRESLDLSRSTQVMPYKPLETRNTTPDQNEMSLSRILDEANLLLELLISLRAAQSGNERIRLEYLIEHTRSLIMRSRYLLGEKVSYGEYCREMFGLVAPAWDGRKLSESLSRLDECLPGDGPLEGRMKAYKERIRIPRDKVPAVMNTAAQFFHNKSVEHMGIKNQNMPRLRYRELGGKEFVTVLFGYDYDEISLEQNFGIDFPYYMDTLREIAGHELEPGHFTFMNLRTKGMVDTGYPELGLNSHNPSGALIEGGARVAIELSLDTPEKEEAFDKELFGIAGLDKDDVQYLPAWRDYIRNANLGKLEIERRLWDREWSRAEAIAFAKKNCIVWSEAEEDAVDHFAEDPAHFTSHDYCRDVFRDYLDRRCATTEEKWALYTRLCQRPFVMSGIVDGSYDPFAFKD